MGVSSAHHTLTLPTPRIALLLWIMEAFNCGWLCVQGARNEIFALQPAPVQTSYMGFPATMGASFLPYLITDKVVAPDSCRPCYSENLALMPNCYFVNDYKHAHMVNITFPLTQ